MQINSLMNKFIFSLLVLLIASTARSQPPKTYVFIGPAMFQALKGGGGVMFGGNAGGGFYFKAASLGLGIDVFGRKAAGAAAPVYADLRIYFNKKVTRPYVTIQPGYVIRNRSESSFGATSTEKGGPYVAGGLGLMAKVSKVGVFIQAKIAMLSFEEVSKYNGQWIGSSSSRPAYVGLAAGIIF